MDKSRDSWHSGNFAACFTTKEICTMSANLNITDNHTPVAHDVRMGIARMRMKMGLKGLGIYFLVRDALDTSGGRLERDYKTLAYMLNVKDKDLIHVVEDFGLFIIRTVYGRECILLPGAESNDVNHAPAANTRPKVRSEADNNAAVSAFSYMHGPGNGGNRKSVAVGADKKATDWRLADHRDRLCKDEAWMAGLASELGFDSAELAVAFDAFADYVTGRAAVSYRTEAEMKKHFENWVRKGCAAKAIEKAREAARQRAGRERYESEQEEARRERLRRAETAVTYAEYCRSKGIETTGDLVADIHSRLA